MERVLQSCCQEIAVRAQRVYDDWESDSDEWQNINGVDYNLGSGGICDIINGEIQVAIFNALWEAGYTDEEDFAIVEGGHDGDDHAWTIVQDIKNGAAWGVDIPCHLYEYGSGYSWTKIDGVTFLAHFIEIWEIEFEAQ